MQSPKKDNFPAVSNNFHLNSAFYFPHYFPVMSHQTAASGSSVLSPPYWFHYPYCISADICELPPLSDSFSPSTEICITDIILFLLTPFFGCPGFLFDPPLQLTKHHICGIDQIIGFDRHGQGIKSLHRLVPPSPRILTEWIQNPAAGQSTRSR